MITQEEARRLALDFAVHHAPFAILEVIRGLYVPADDRPIRDAISGAWSFHFPLILKDGVEKVDPGVVVIHVEEATGETGFLMLL